MAKIADILLCHKNPEAMIRHAEQLTAAGDGMAIKTAEYTHHDLDDHDCDFIGTSDYFESDRIKTGMKEERLICRHFFDERKRKKLFHTVLKAQRRLGVLCAARDVHLKISAEDLNLFKFLTGRGRIGHRFATRFWETESTPGQNGELMIILCKKCHVAKRLLEKPRTL